MFNDGSVVELNANYGYTINPKVEILPTVTPNVEFGIAASGNYLFIANGSPGTVAEYTAAGILVNPTFIVPNQYEEKPVVALFVAPGVK